MEINNPYLAIINDKNKYNPNIFKGMKFEKIDVKMGDWFKKTGLIERETLEALNNAILKLRSVSATCTVNSAGRTQFDQVYAKVEKFAGVLKNTKSIKQAINKTRAEVARIGYSEHLSNLAVDLRIDTQNMVVPPRIKQKYPNVTNINTLKFLTKRLIMEQSGFILRYPISPRLKEVTGVANPEGWHWRYVGAEHSQKIAKIREYVTNTLNIRDENNDLITQEVFLEDYIKILQQGFKADSEHDLLQQYADYFIKNILCYSEQFEVNQSL